MMTHASYWRSRMELMSVLFIECLSSSLAVCCSTLTVWVYRRTFQVD